MIWKEGRLDHAMEMKVAVARMMKEEAKQQSPVVVGWVLIDLVVENWIQLK